MEPLVTRFTQIFAGLKAAVAACLPREQSRAPLLVLAWHYLHRTANRLQRLLAHWQSGTLPAPRPPRPGRVQTPRTTPRLPSGRAWLLRHAQPAAVFGAQLQALANQPGFAEFLRAAPQAARLLRPVLHMLTIDPMPAPLARPPRPPREKPARPPRPEPPRDRPLPAYVRAAIRAWKPRHG